MITVNLVPIFATPFAVVDLPQLAALNAPLAARLTAQATPEQADPAFRPDPLCFRSRETLLESREPLLAEVFQGLIAGLCEAVMETNVMKREEFVELSMQARSRFTIVRPDGALPAATAPLASWYGLYCVATPPPSPTRADSALLRLYAVRGAQTFIDAASFRMREPYSGSHYTWRPVAGQMAVFPGSMLHEVAMNRSDTDLILIAMRARFAHGEQLGLPGW